MPLLDGYRFDVFLSYRRSGPGNAGAWVRDHFHEMLKDCLADELGSSEVFLDLEAETGVRWPSLLRDVLARSKVLVAVWSPPYFQSPWCLAEWRTMEARERALAGRTRLVYPLRYSGGDNFSEDARERPSALVHAPREHQRPVAVVASGVGVRGVVALQANVGGDHGVRAGTAGEISVQQGAHGAVGAVGGGQVAAADGGAVGEGGGDRLLVLGEGGQLVLALDVHVVFGEVLFQDALDHHLRDRAPRVAVPGPGERERDAREVGGSARVVAGGQKRFQQAALVEDLQHAGLHAARLGQGASTAGPRSA